MKLKGKRSELLTAFQRVQGVVEKRNTMPILSNILLEAKDGEIVIFATDLEIGIRGRYPADVTEPARLEELAEAARAETGRLDVWINNAGILERGVLPETGPDHFEITRGTHAVIETLKTVRNVTRRGITINTFMLDDAPELVGFVERMTEINKGRAFFTMPNQLGNFLTVDYLAQKRSRFR